MRWCLCVLLSFCSTQSLTIWFLHSHGRLVDSLLKCLPAVFVFIIEEAHNPKGVGKAMAIGLSKRLCSYQFVATLLLFGDVLPEIDRLCRLFQTEDLDLSAISTNIRSTLVKLVALAEKPSSFWFDRADALIASVTKACHDRSKIIEAEEEKRRNTEKEAAAKLKEDQKVLQAEAQERGEEYELHADPKKPLKGNLMNSLRKFQIISSEKNKAQWDLKTRKAWLQAVVLNMTDRFADDPIATALDTLFNPALFPADPLPDTYAVSSLEVLLGHYGVKRGGQEPLIDAEKARRDWGHFVFKMEEVRSSWAEQQGKDAKDNKESKGKAKALTMQGLLKPILSSSWRKSCPGIALLAESALVFPPHTVANETGFSKVTLVKTDLRSLLLETGLNDLLMPLIEGPNPCDFDAAACVRRWFPLKERRLPIFDLPACKSLRTLKAEASTKTNSNGKAKGNAKGKDSLKGKGKTNTKMA